MRIHDLTKRHWGHDYTFEPIDSGMQGRMTGWNAGIHKGDYLILQNGADTTRYKVKTIKYYPDPPDMFNATVEFAPRSSHD